MTSFLYHPLFPDGLVGQNMKPWFDGHLFRFADVVDHSTRKVLPFNTLQTKFSLPIRCYLQICHLMQQVLSADPVSLPTRFEKICRMDSSTKGLIYELHQILIDLTPR